MAEKKVGAWRWQLAQERADRVASQYHESDVYKRLRQEKKDFVRA